MKKTVSIQSYPGLQVFGANQYVHPIRSRAAPVRWHVRKLKRVWYIPIQYPIIISAILWAVFGVYYAFCIYPAESCLMLFVLVIAMGLASFLSRK